VSPASVIAASAPHLVATPINTAVATALVALLMLLHIQFAAFQQGGYLILAVTDFMGWKRNDQRQTRFSKGLVTALGATFAIGSSLAIFTVLILFLGLWSHFFVTLVRIMFWPLIVEAIAFVGEIACLYLLYSQWERLSNFRALRVGMELLLFINASIQMLAIDVVASYMLTPRPSANLALNLLNPTEIPLEIHRFVGNIAFAGAVIALVGGIRILFSKRPEARAYGDWMGHYGLIYAIGFTLAQPLIGWEYAKEIQLHAYASWYSMMLGGLSVAFLFQVFLLGAIFTVGIFYLWRRVVASGFRSRALAICTAISFASWLLISTPSSLAWSYEDVFAANANVPIWQGGLLIPWGEMIPFKLVALIAFTGVAIWAVTVYLKHVSNGEMRWGDAGRGQAAALIAVGVAVSLIMALMGYIREDSRSPFLITDQMLINQQQNFTPPSQPGPAMSGPSSSVGVIVPWETTP
jgi:cytochrome d ubiquinol oxidase subunit I